MNTLPRLADNALNTSVIETAIRVEPATIHYRLSEQDREDITFNEELKDIMKNIIIVGVIALLAIII